MRTSRWRGAMASAASAAVLVAVPLVGAQSASAQTACTVYPASLCLTVSAVTVAAGDELTISASGFEPRQTVTVVLESHRVVLGTYQADANGLLTERTVTIPRRIRPGYHTLKLIAHNPAREFTVRIRVLRPNGAPGNGGPGNGGPGDHKPGGTHHHGSDCGPRGRDACGVGNGSQGGIRQESASLASTGSDTNTMLAGAAGALLVTAGCGTVAAARRRRNS